MLKAAKVRCVVSFYLLVAAVGVFQFWSFYFDFPPSLGLRLFGFEKIPVGVLVVTNGFILGGMGLSGLLSSKNVVDLLTHLHRPYALLTEDLRRLYSSWGCVALSVAVFVCFVLICSSNVTVDIHAPVSDMNLILDLEEGDDVLVWQRGDSGDRFELGHRARLSEGSKVSVVLRGYKARARGYLRDRYNFLTLDAVIIKNSFFGVEAEDLHLALGSLPAGLSQAQRNLLRMEAKDRLSDVPVVSGLWSLTFGPGPFRFGRRLPSRVVDSSGRVFGPKGNLHLFLDPADGRSCPAKAPGGAGGAEIQKVWDQLCAEQDVVAEWRDRPIVWMDDRWGYTTIELADFHLQVSVARSEYQHPARGEVWEDVEPITLAAVHRDAPPAQLGLSTGLEDLD